MSTRRARGVGALAAAAVLTAIVAALMAGGAGAGSQSALALPRAQTLYMSGNQWSPNIDLNPGEELGLRHRARRLRVRDAVPLRPARRTSSSRGSRRAASGRRRRPTSMTIRKGVKWSDGTDDDAGRTSKYSFDLLKIPTHPQHALWADTGLKSTKVSGNDVVFTFAGDPGLPAVRLLPLQRRDRAAARLQGLHRRPRSRPAT